MAGAYKARRALKRKLARRDTANYIYGVHKTRPNTVHCNALKAVIGGAARAVFNRIHRRNPLKGRRLRAIRKGCQHGGTSGY